MELLLNDVGVFKKSIEAISVLIDEAEIDVSEIGLALKATDPSQISMVDFYLPKKAFEKFESENTRLGLNLSYLNQILSRSHSADKLVLSLDEKKSFLEVKFVGKAERTFQIPLIDLSTTEVPSPKIDFDSEIIVNASFIQNALKDASLISSHITLGCDEEKFFVIAKSSKGNLSEEAREDKETVLELKVKNESKSMFPLDYLQDMLKTASGETTIFLKTNKPIKISYNIGEASITYFLAPRIENA